MAGYEIFLRMQRIQDLANKMGFRLAKPKHGWHGGSNDGADTVSVYPLDDKLPVFCRDAELFVGTFDQVQVWLAGWERARSYDMMLRVSDDKKRKKAEDAYIERRHKEQERLEKRKMFAILANREEKDVERIM